MILLGQPLNIQPCINLNIDFYFVLENPEQESLKVPEKVLKFYLAPVVDATDVNHVCHHHCRNRPEVCGMRVFQAGPMHEGRQMQVLSRSHHREEGGEALSVLRHARRRQGD